MLKYVNTGIVFQEIPNEVTLAINISNCPCHCPGCHSHYLWEDIGLPLNADAIDAFADQYGKDITCISFMGGDSDPKGVNQLAQYIHEEKDHHLADGKQTGFRLYQDRPLHQAPWPFEEADNQPTALSSERDWCF